MNYSIIRYILCRIIQITGLLLSLPLLVSLLYAEWDGAAVFALLALLCLLCGTFGCRVRPKRMEFYAREGFVVTALSWIVISGLGALPFVLTGEIPFYIDALFETVSGFTTTGASILAGNQMEQMRRGVMFWRLFTHWVGGMGVLVFMMAILPMAGGHSMHLMRAESPGPSVGKFVPRVKDTAKILYSMYIFFTLSEILCLMLAGLPLYDASTITFSTVGTGGFALTADSANAYPLAAQTVITVFMTLCGVNFSVYYFLLTKRPREAFASDEARWYLATMLGAAGLIAVNIRGAGILTSGRLAFHHALFTVSSIMTTTGFATLDYDVWPEFSRTLLLFLMIIGACAGSTGGGMKFSRLVILVRNIRNELTFVVHPNSVQRVHMDGRRVDGMTVKSVSAYLAIYTGVMLLSVLLLSLNGFDFETNFSAVAATMNNIGPGLRIVGPTGGYQGFSVFSKLILTFDMLAGRLEFLPMLILFTPRTWRR